MTEIDPIEKAMFAGFGPQRSSEASGDSALAFLSACRGVRSHINLREAGDPSARLLVKPLAGSHGNRAKQLGKYQLLGEVARGGVGVILRAHDTDLGRDIAIKLLRDRYQGNAALLQRFVEEAQIGGQLEHPGIVPVYDLGVEDGNPFFTMKLVQGRTLAELLKQRVDEKADLRRFLSMFEQVCLTIAYAHARGVIHRDLKPANVMIGAFGEVQVMDWGMGKVLKQDAEGEAREIDNADIIETIRSIRRNASDSQSIVGSVMGTPAYMPPEQARGEVDKMDERSDVFTLGAILVEILTGRPPYVGPHCDLVRAAKECDLADVFECLDRSGADAALVELVRDCMCEDLGRRPTDASVVAERVGDHLSSVERRAQQSKVDAAEARVHAAAARRAQRLTIALALAVLVIVAVCVGGYAWLKYDEDTRRSDTNGRLERALQEASISRGRAQAGGENAAWTEAQAAASELEVLLESALIRTDLRERAKAFVSLVAAEQARANRAAEQARRDDAMVAELESILMPDDYSVRDNAFFSRDARRKIKAFDAAFRAYGLPVDELVDETDDDVLAEKIAASAITVELAAALDHWASMRRLVGEGDVNRLYRISIAADPDEWRVRLRELYIAHRHLKKELMALAESAKVESLPAITLASFAGGMFGVGLRRPALALFRRGYAIYPRDFYLTYLYALALEQTDRPDYQGAVRIYTAALTIRPDNVQVAHRLGVNLMKLGRYVGAARILRSVVKKKPDFAFAFAALCEAERRTENVKAAVKAGREAVRLAPESAFCKVNCSAALQNAGRLKDAVEMCKEAVRLDANYATGWAILGSIHSARGEFAAAVDASRRATELREGYVQAHNNLGYALYRLGRYEEASARLRLALRLQPDYVRSRNNLVNALQKSGDREGAVAELRAILSYNPRHARSHLRLGGFLFEMGQHEAGIRAMREAVRLRPRSADYRYRLGNACLFAKRHEDAIAAYRVATRLNPKHVMSWVEMSEALRLTGNADGAREARETALKLDPEVKGYFR